MKKLLLIAVIVSAIVPIACSKQPSQPTDEIVVYPATVGDKNELYEVEATNRLKLAPGVRAEVVEGPGGRKNAILLRRANGATGGYILCECLGATQGNCTTTNDNPEHPSCAGGCTDSEGNARGCQFSGMTGPPKDPAMIRFRARK